ncbi:NAD-dependent epimerase/dehydratase family protein [Phycisphaerales bacterium AB-hyl4]|uniref:NAD-dependent epimerase/dehydratase family protein n=1 Tax=Natronomicrosphaera hydrolytica TaxID=3242702 RepID=A0ABV4U8G4_9BACT
MHLLITGATGFLGQHVVQTALARGHHVRALIRPAASFHHPSNTNLTLARHDLRNPQGLVDHLENIDAVLHLAAAKVGSYYTQMASTVVATENLLAAMHAADVDRLVLISSFTVYDYLAIPSRSGRGVLDENSPLESEPARRDDYCRTKLWQERLVREAVDTHNLRATILRPGVVYAEPEHLWTDRLGVRVGRTWFAIGSRARLPLTHADHCAHAIVRAAERDAAVGQTINLVDDNPPTQRRYRRALRPRMQPRIIPINWTLMRAFAWSLDMLDRRLFQGELRLPAIVRRRALHARCRPLQYPNRRARDLLDWHAPARWQTATAPTLTQQPPEAHDVPPWASPLTPKTETTND